MWTGLILLLPTLVFAGQTGETSEGEGRTRGRSPAIVGEIIYDRVTDRGPSAISTRKTRDEENVKPVVEKNAETPDVKEAP